LISTTVLGCSDYKWQGKAFWGNFVSDNNCHVASHIVKELLIKTY